MQNTCIILSSAGYGKSVYKRRFYTTLKFQYELALTNKERIMKTNVKKSLAVFAAILTAASAFAGCSSESTLTETTSAETTVSAADTVEDSEAEVSDDNNQELAFDSGDGSESDPYCISTADQLLLVNNDLTANYKLNADIDLSSLNGKTVIAGYTYEYVDMTTGDMDMSKTFNGVFGGNGHTLSNYTYKNDGNQMAVGIFGAVTAEGNEPVGLGGIAGGVAEITFDEGTVSGIDDKGNSIFSHEYEFCGYDETNGFYEYKSTDDNEDEFTYFCLLTDTPASAFHIEFILRTN